MNFKCGSCNNDLREFKQDKPQHYIWDKFPKSDDKRISN